MSQTPPQSNKSSEARPQLDGPRRTTIGALCKALDFPQLAVERLVETLCGGAMDILKKGEVLSVPGFGHFTPRHYRPRGPSKDRAIHPWDPSELPYSGPVDFEASAALKRQLDSGNLSARAVYTCPPLLDALTQVAGVPRGHAAQVVRIFFVTLVDLLLVEKSCIIPGLGTFTNVRGPTQLLVDVRNDKVTGTVPRRVRFRPSPTLLDGLPSIHHRAPFSVIDPRDLPLAQLSTLDDLDSDDAFSEDPAPFKEAAASPPPLKDDPLDP